jgi:hypothetical protein
MQNSKLLNMYNKILETIRPLVYSKNETIRRQAIALEKALIINK